MGTARNFFFQEVPRNIHFIYIFCIVEIISFANKKINLTKSNTCVQYLSFLIEYYTRGYTMAV